MFLICLIHLIVKSVCILIRGFMILTFSLIYLLYICLLCLWFNYLALISVKEMLFLAINSGLSVGFYHNNHTGEMSCCWRWLKILCNLLYFHWKLFLIWNVPADSMNSQHLVKTCKVKRLFVIVCSVKTCLSTEYLSCKLS